MNRIISTFIVGLFLSQSVMASNLSPTAQAIVDTGQKLQEIDLQKVLSKSQDKVQTFILSHYKTEDDKKHLTQLLKQTQWKPLKVEYAKSAGKMTIYIEDYFIELNDFDFDKKHFKLNGELVDLSKVNSLKELTSLYQKIANPLKHKVSWNPLNKVISSAHALGPVALGLIAFAATGAFMEWGNRLRRYLVNLRSKVNRANRICTSLDEPYNIMNYDGHIREFLGISQELQAHSSSRARSAARRSGSCNDIRESGMRNLESWVYSIRFLTWEDYQEELATLCERAEAIHGCIRQYRQRRAAINSDERDPQGRTFMEQMRRRRDSAPAAEPE